MRLRYSARKHLVKLVGHVDMQDGVFLADLRLIYSAGGLIGNFHFLLHRLRRDGFRHIDDALQEVTGEAVV